jgi:putative oxidoreductase
MDDMAFLVLRLVSGGLLTGHGAQKLFGAFEGPGLQGTKAWLESMGLRPAPTWAFAAGLSEFGGGLLTALGLAHPIGPLGIVAAMGMATAKVHWGKPIWVTTGGAELPVTNMAVAASLMLAGPGKFSLDEALGIHIPGWVALPGLALVGAGVALGTLSSAPKPDETEQRVGGELQSGQSTQEQVRAREASA